MGESGPTQGAEKHTAALEKGWTARPRLAKALRVFLFLVPLLVSFGFSIAAGRIAPAEDLGMNRWLWIAVVFVLANILLVIMRGLTARLIPLVALMKLTLVFPDSAPSRTKAALRKSNSRTMLRTMREAQERGEQTGEALNGDYLVQLLREVNEHDRLTRGHSERVRAYAELLGEEIGLDDDDLNKLRWAALLHDVGKLTVPAEILNKDGRPTDDEWKVLSNHPAAGIPMLEPLRDWLGDWIHAADQHHCRWDGGGYPSKLAGTDITLAGRLVAIADAYDVMTSTRSYKKPFPPETARQELTDCAGGQFDPTLVRAFLRIGLGRLKTVAGPLAWLSNLTGSAQLPLPAANVVSTGAWSAGVAATGLVTVGVTSVFAPTPPEAIALDVPVVIAENVALSSPAGDEIEIVLTATGESLVFTLGGAAHGDVELVSFPQPLDADPPKWQAVASYTPTEMYVGEDGFSFEVCNLDGLCDQGSARLVLMAPEPVPTTASSTTTVPPTTASTTPPTAPPTTNRPVTLPPTTAPSTTTAPTTETTTTTEATTTSTTEAEENLGPTVSDDLAETNEDQPITILVLDNDIDPEGVALSVSGVGAPIHGQAQVVGAGIAYQPPNDFFGTDQFTYTATDGINPGALATVVVTVLPVNDPPAVTAPDSSIDESAPVGSIVATVTVVDPDDADFTYTLQRNNEGLFSIDANGVIRVAAPLDFEDRASYDLIARVSDGEIATRESILITVLDVDEAPDVANDSATTDEDTAVDISVLSNDVEPEGQAMTVGVDSLSASGGTVSEVDGVVTYTPPPDFEGVDSFQYTAEDPSNNVSTEAVVTITVNAVNDAPIVVVDSGAGFETNEDASFTTADVRQNDTDVDDPIATSTVEVVSDVTRGVLTNNGDGTFSYAPNPDLFGPDTFSYRLVDGHGAPSAPAWVTISVAPVNDAPTAVDDTLTVVPGGSVISVDLRGNDSDVDGDALTVSDVTDGSAGTVVNNGNGTVTYSHGGSAGTSDWFTYTIQDRSGATATAQVNVTVSAADRDGVGAGDNCPNDYNPTQIDTDSDGLGDACDATPTNSSGASFPSTGVGFAGSTDSMALAAADFDGDGRTDVVLANDGQANRVFRNSFGGLLLPGHDLGGTSGQGVAAGDMNGDGTMDLVFAYGDVSNDVWLNDGTSSFIRVSQTLDSADSRAVAIGDFDGDGDLDVVFANDGEANTVWFNDGSGRLTSSMALPGTADTRGVSVADLDGDTHLDIVFSNDGQPDTIWFNDGSGGFTNSGQIFGAGRSHASAIGDLDGDGDLDLVIAGDNDGDSVWLNDGSGAFGQSGPIIGRGHSRAVALGDLDGDGDLDVAFGDHDGSNSVWLNDGDAVFTDTGATIGDESTEGIILVDLDGDGDLGIVTANDGQANRIYTNS